MTHHDHDCTLDELNTIDVDVLRVLLQQIHRCWQNTESEAARLCSEVWSHAEALLVTNPLSISLPEPSNRAGAYL